MTDRELYDFRPDELVWDMCFGELRQYVVIGYDPPTNQVRLRFPGAGGSHYQTVGKLNTYARQKAALSAETLT